MKPVRDSLKTAYGMLARFRPASFWRTVDRRSRKIGFRKLYLALSFDCDTPEDTAAALEVDARVRDLGIYPAYAVPGAILEIETGVYSTLRDKGAEFLNHGYAQHTFWNQAKNRYESCFFYDALSWEQIRDDIRRGADVLNRTLGVSPLGFRAPHFGTLRGKRRLRQLHAVLAPMGFAYSTSTDPYYTFRYGPAFKKFGLLELPVTGMFSRPLSILDSWGFFAAPDRTLGPDDFLAEAKKMVNYCRETQMVGILNFYADPSHVRQESRFYQAVELWRAVAESVQLRNLCRAINL
jgi:hypothetical protein